MRETIRKLGLMGIGAWALTEEKVNELVKELVEKGEMSREEGRMVFQEIIDERQRQKEHIEAKINERVNQMIEQTNLATKEDLKKLASRVEKLENAQKEEMENEENAW
ncbi:phasin family protein [Methanosalsum natronophilum]|uniref:Polyhydroxyalkanoate synthesis regulator n=1 Tax=Methanosalsum natronophilum TaxID=768733 RepID=A0A3R7WEY1_9EURY|nr:phasin family protein [Methanosalsum natronophilum]MCS3923148.1 polyhydroxyalkanoate synthesis regulator phasin [Methanosalsum natronophilum]RQD87387.1 MAG: hypothetical protein D5R95_03545 [Methanosalsum natronophilum]